MNAVFILTLVYVCASYIFEEAFANECQQLECAKCDEDSQCLECKKRFGGLSTSYEQNGTKVVVGTCINCETDGCLKCPDITKCMKCKKNHGTCEVTATACQPKLCKVCDEATSQCAECKNGYGGLSISEKNGRRVITGNCQRCETDGCLKCPDITKCIKCRKNHNTCKVTATGCRSKACNVCDVLTSECLECKKRYGGLSISEQNGRRVIKGICERCEIDGCLICPDVTKCMKCKKNHDTCEVTKTECTKPIAGCLKCSNEKCESCVYGTYIDDKGKCAACPWNCLSCADYKECTSCKSGYGCKITVHRASCEKCADDFCESCTEDYNKCEMCIDSYEHKDGKCQFVLDDYCSDEGCAKCPINDNKCKKCKTGYRKVGKDCITCPNDELECTRCSLSNPDCFVKVPPLPICPGCTDQQCKSCPEQRDACDQCNDGYFIEASKCDNCRAHIANCLKCENGETCTKCDPLYKVKQGKCILT